jgi:membrane fusion protein, multidrug efflux system
MTTTTPPRLDLSQGAERSYPPNEPGLLPPSQPKRHGLVWLILLLIVAGITGYAVWRASKPVPVQNTQGGPFGRRGGAVPGGLPVEVAPVTRASIPFYLNGLGNVTAFYTVTVKSRVDGQFMKADFNEGDLVKQGQVIVELDPRPYQVQLDSAEAALAHDEAQLTDAKLDLDRYQKLFNEGVIPRQQLDSQVALAGGYEGTIKQDQANIENAKLQLVYAKITAPITGIAGLRQVDPGNIIHAADTTGIVVITQLQPIAVLFTIPEDSLPDVAKKLRAGIHLQADAYNRDNSKKLASGTVLTLDNQINNTTGTSTLKAVFDNKDNALFPQQFVNVRVLVDTLKDQLTVPNVAIQNGQQGPFVYVVDNGSRVHIRPVQVGITAETTADILGGVSEGERVVVAGTDRLVDGAQVRVRRPGELNQGGGGEGNGRMGRGRGRGQSQGGGDTNFAPGRSDSNAPGNPGPNGAGRFNGGNFNRPQGDGAAGAGEGTGLGNGHGGHGGHNGFHREGANAPNGENGVRKGPPQQQ